MENKFSEMCESAERTECGFKFTMKPREYIGGDYVSKDGEVSAEDLEAMKAEVVDNICKLIKLAAETYEDFFIIEEHGGTTTVGAKFIIPTIKF